MSIEKVDLRLEALKRFGIAITILNIAGHLFLGFEQSWAQPITALITAYCLELLFEWLNCKINGYKPRYLGGFKKLVFFLLPAHISALAVSMLLFANVKLFPIILGTAIAILSKVLFRVQIGNKKQHFLNPSNTGIVFILILFPWVGIAPPYQFTENISGLWDWVLPCLFISVGSLLNTKLTKRIPLIIAWFGGFTIQAILRCFILQTPVLAALNPMTGVSFLLFSFYMVSDPATTPGKLSNQILFGLCLSFVYGLLVYFQIVFGLFFSLFIVCCSRGLYFEIYRIVKKVRPEKKDPNLLTSNGQIEKLLLLKQEA